MAKKLGWTRQRLNKITTGAHEPDIYEAAALAGVLNISVDGIADIFLRHKSPNGPHINADSMRKDVS